MIEKETYQWDVKDTKVTVTFVREFPVTYCTISVVEPDGKIKHYHGGTVYNMKDRYNVRTGMFNAFRCALKLRYGDYIYDCFLNDKDFAEWVDYHRYWTHFLSALIDGLVVDYAEFYNSTSI